MCVVARGSTIAQFQVTAKLGEGGMGEVWRARDTKLDRDVALKILPPELTRNEQRVRRFEREARSASGLSHPHIVVVHEIGYDTVRPPAETTEGPPLESDSVHFIAMELVDGETLRDQLQQKGTRLKDLLRWLSQVADALAKAHAAGIVHRDLKPDNIMVSREGYAKVLDFGLAKLVERAAASASQAPTEEATAEGTVLGTVGYMSPEQVKGREVDHRSDVFSFGCLLYEAVTRKRAFSGETSIDVMHQILRDQPPGLGEIDPRLRRMIRHCLEKQPERRYQSTSDLAFELAGLVEQYRVQKAGDLAELGNSGLRDQAKGSVEAPRRLGWIAGAALAGTFLGGTIMWQLAAPGPTGHPEGAPTPGKELPRSVNVLQLTTAPGREIFPAFSPDGRLLSYSSAVDSHFEIFVRPMAFGGREIKLTSDGQHNVQPAWSPDGQLVAYCSLGRGGIWVVPALGGAPRQVTEFGASPAWSPDGQSLVFQSTFGGVRSSSNASGPQSQLWLVSRSGGTPEPLTQPGEPPGPHGAPSFSPGGELVAFESGLASQRSLWLARLDDAGLTHLETPCRPRDPAFSPEGPELYFVCDLDGRGLWKFDLDARGVANGPAQLVEPLTDGARHLDVAPGGQVLAFSRYSHRSNLWSLHLSLDSSRPTGPPVPLTRETNLRNYPAAFSPDGSRIAYQVIRSGSVRELWLMDATGEGHRPLVRSASLGRGKMTWLAGTRELAFSSGDSWVSFDVETQRQRVVVDLGQEWGEPQLSPDGARLAYSTPTAGVENVWVLDIGTGTSRQVTFDPEFAGWPVWSPDGSMLAVEIARQGGLFSHQGVVPAAGGDLVQLTFEPTQDYVHDWSPDGDKLLFARSGRNIWWVSRSDGSEQQLTTYDGSEFSFVRYPIWSPGGDQIVFEVAHSTSDIWLLEFE